MAGERTSKGEATRQHILQCALACFRKKGYAQATMRDVAAAAELSLGAAYHYFPSKDAIVAAYYEWTQDEHERRLADDPGGPVAARMQRALDAKLDIVGKDRKIMAAQLGQLGDASHPLSLFGRETASLRRRSIAVFERVFADTALSPELRALAGYAAWLVHLGILLVLVHDGSRKLERVHALIAAASELFGMAVAFAGTPMAAPLVRRALSLAQTMGVPGVSR